MTWFRQIDRDASIFSGARLIELGPQDLWGCVAEMFDPQLPEGSWGRDLYLRLGVASYTSLDLSDSRAIPFDYNESRPDADLGVFDVVTNIGTSEHVFSQDRVMRLIHRLTAAGGTMIHVVPVGKGRDHGYFNYQPQFFRDLARANSYEVLSMTLVPAIAWQTDRERSVVAAEIARRRLGPVNELAVWLRAILRPSLLSNFMPSRRGRYSLWDVLARVTLGDYLYVAFRKTTDKELIAPIQGSRRQVWSDNS